MHRVNKFKRGKKKNPVLPINLKRASCICMFYELRIQLVNLTKEKLSAWFKSEGNPRGEGTIFTELRSVEGKEVKTNGLFCRVYSVHTEWEIITEKKKKKSRFIRWPFGVFFIFGPSLRDFF